MPSLTLLLYFSLLCSLSSAAETVLGLYIFARHGDRTPKIIHPTLLTDFGYSEIFSSGTWFRNQYIANGAPSQIHGIEPDIVKLSQIAASSPLDTVLMPSCVGFLQGLYPPVGPTLGSQKLGNGTVVQSPLNGYQLIPVATLSTGTANEESAWIQGSGNCAKAIVSSNNYFDSQEYLALENSTMGFYNSLKPVINATVPANETSFKSAYSIYDIINVATIHNATIPSSNLLDPATLFQLRTLADTHEFNLAYNASDPIRAITGATLAAQIVQALNTTISTQGKTPLNIQFGAYGGFQSFVALANLTSANSDFYGIPDYASTMTFELFTNVAPSPFPRPEDLNVRFLFHNGTTGNNSVPVAYPLFGQSSTTLSWNDFVHGMNGFAIGNQSVWCDACGNTTGICASGSGGPSGPGSAGSSSGNGSGSNGVSKAVAGVIGAMVTLAVILGVEALIILIAGLRLVRKNRLTGVGNGHVEGQMMHKA